MDDRTADRREGPLRGDQAVRGGAGEGADPALDPTGDDGLDPDTVTTTVVAVPPATALDGAGPGEADADPVADTGGELPGDPVAGPPGGGADPVADFPVVLRGYERHRVDAALADLRSQLDAAVTRYQAAEAALAAARAAVADADQRIRRAEEARKAAEADREDQQGRLTPEALSGRVRRILELAEEEAQEIRSSARRDAEAATAASRAEIEQLRQRRARYDAELTQLRARITALLGNGDRQEGAGR